MSGPADEVLKQASEFDRHYDRISWYIGSIVFPFSLGALAFIATQLDKVSGFSLLGVALFSTSLLAVWLLVIERLGTYQEQRTRAILAIRIGGNWNTQGGNWMYLAIHIMLGVAWTILMVAKAYGV